MELDESDLNAAIEDGSYFREGRAWYATVYMAIISERYFFIVLTAIAALAATFALTAVIRLLPLNPRLPFIYQASNAYEQVPNIKPIRRSREEPINDALRRFFIVQYITRREGYSSASLGDRLNFIRSNSDPATYDRFAKLMNPDNPRSPAQRLGNFYTMSATVDPDTIMVTPVVPKDPKDTKNPPVIEEPQIYNVSVEYTLQLISQSVQEESRYRADLVMRYKDLLVSQTEAKDKDEHFVITPMEFQVTDYRFKKLR